MKKKNTKSTEFPKLTRIEMNELISARNRMRSVFNDVENFCDVIAYIYEKYPEFDTELAAQANQSKWTLMELLTLSSIPFSPPSAQRPKKVPMLDVQSAKDVKKLLH